MQSEKCSICQHEELNNIDVKLASGVSVRTLAAEYDLGRMALQRHRANHLPKTMVKARELQEADAADKLLEKVQGLYDKAMGIMDKAEQSGKYAPAVSAIKEARASLELIGKLIGELQTGHTVNITYNQEFIQARQLITTALLPYPEAREAVVRALEGDIQDAEYEEIN